jgi:ParB-like chromosome segregation protein Spo0J
MEPTIHTAHDELWNIEDLKPNPRNPNKHPEKQVALLAKIIQEQGWRTPITVSKRSGLIVRGHARLQAAQKLGLKQVPVDLQEYESDEKEMADLLADNQIADLAEMDGTELKDILEELTATGLDMDLTGFDMHELEELLFEPNFDPVSIDEQPRLDEKKKVVCPECGNEFTP